MVGMGVLPVEFTNGDTRQSLGLTGFETFDIVGLSAGLMPHGKLSVKATSPEGSSKSFDVLARIDTPEEMRYYTNGGILPYVLRQLVGGR
jgi:aconitate hydratase